MNLTSLTIQTNFLLCTQTFGPKRLTQKPRRIGDRFGSMGKGVWDQGSVLCSVTAAKRAEPIHPGSEQPFTSWKREMNVLIFGFAFDL